MPRRSDPEAEPARIPRGAIAADQAKLLHDNTYGPRPIFYVDRPFTCIECGTQEVWSAKDQKWWYEEAQGKIDSGLPSAWIVDEKNNKVSNVTE